MADILQRDGLTIELLKALSYQSELGINLKKNLHYFDKNLLFEELIKVNMWYDEFAELHELALDYRVKSVQSAMLKYERYYPIEIQYNTYYDRQFNNWIHKYIYKKNYANGVGIQLREMYENAKIQTEREFKEALKHVLSDC